MDKPVVLLMCRVAALSAHLFLIVRISIAHMLFDLSQVMRLYLGLDSYALVSWFRVLCACFYIMYFNGL